MPANDSPFWSILRTVVVGCLLLTFLWANYQRVDERDASTILYVLLGLAGFDVAQAKMSHKSSPPSDPPSS